MTTPEKFMNDHGIWVWAQPKTRTDNSVCWVANARYVPTQRRDNGLEVDPIAYKECDSIEECYEYAFDYLSKRPYLEPFQITFRPK